MDTKKLFISVGELHPAIKDAHIHDMATALVEKMRENMETMLPAFPFKDDKERQSAIEQALIVYGWGVRDGIEEWVKHRDEL